jgi:hypothetical protein
MSWCRWSTDIDGKCQSDLYIYESVGDNIVVHIAGRRRINYKDNPYNDNRSILNLKQHEIVEWCEQGRKQTEWMNENTIWEDLPEDYSGKTFQFEYDEMDSMKEFLEQAEKDGINFPPYIYAYVQEIEQNGEKD